MIIEDKWKMFALRHILSDWGRSGIELFDQLGTLDAEKVFEDHGVVPWYPFEHFEAVDLAEMILDMAKKAQETSELD